MDNTNILPDGYGVDWNISYNEVRLEYKWCVHKNHMGLDKSECFDERAEEPLILVVDLV
jgi:hypothetical protein